MHAVCAVCSAHRLEDTAGAGQKGQEAAASSRAGQPVVDERSDALISQIKHLLQHVCQVDARHCEGVLPACAHSLRLVQQPSEQARLLLCTICTIFPETSASRDGQWSISRSLISWMPSCRQHKTCIPKHSAQYAHASIVSITPLVLR